MTAPVPHTSGFSTTRLALIVGASVAAIVLGHVFDRTALASFAAPDAANEDWNRALRITGYVPTWLVIALAFALIDRARAVFLPPLLNRWSRAATIALAPILAGLLAELLKLLIRRERPDPDAHALYAFRPFAQDTWSTSGLGMPSSHTAVSFAAAYILARLHPPAAPLWFALALGCALTRMLSGAHFLSDAIGGALTGLAAGAITWRLHLARAPKAVTP